MKIHDSLRQECMPEMVYSICKLAGSKVYDKDEIKRLITLNSSELQTYNKVYRFAIESGFIIENADNKVIANFTDKELANFKNFRYAIFMDIFKNSNTVFTELAKWYLSQETDIFTNKSAQELSVVIPDYMFAGIEKDYVLGFRFWAVALGFAMLQKAGSGSTLVFATNQILQDWLTFAKPLKKRKAVLAKEFFDKLVNDCPLFGSCINENNINSALSMGLRVLHLNEVIELKYTTDSGDIWHLTNSISNPKTNNITEIIVR